MWTKSGDLTIFYNSGGPVNRYCGYSNSSPDSMISELFISRCRDESYQIRVKASSTEAYNHLNQAIISAGFPKPDFLHKTLKIISIDTADQNRLRAFLKAIKQEESSFNLIEDELISILNLTNLNVTTPLSTWNKEHSFTDINRDHGSLLNREVSYTTSSQDSLIKKFCLLGYSDNTYMFYLELSEHSNALKDLLRNSGLNITIGEHKTRSPIVRFCFNSNNRGRFEQLLTLLSQNSTHFSEIKEQFKQHVNPILSAANTALPTRTIFQNFNNVDNVLPATSANQQKLDICKFSEDELSPEEKEQYEKYCCALSREVMSDPVYDPDVPQYQFERSWILRSLASSKEEHPFTRGPLTQEKLVPNTKLKDEIDSYVNEVVHAKSSKHTLK